MPVIYTEWREGFADQLKLEAGRLHSAWFAHSPMVCPDTDGSSNHIDQLGPLGAAVEAWESELLYSGRHSNRTHSLHTSCTGNGRPCSC